MPRNIARAFDLAPLTTDAGTRPWLRIIARTLALVAVGTTLVLGWRELWFITDDSYITFRYIDHFRRGWGYTWNPPPFAPVEGYSNFLWMVLLHAVWVVTGRPPPASANVVALVLAAGSLALAFACTYRMQWSPALRRHRFWLALAVAAFAATHRTFLTWTSSGLETSLFCFCTMLWTYGMLEASRGQARRALTIAVTGGALAALTRPDGMLMLLAAVAMLGYAAITRRNLRDVLLAALPASLVPAHLLWRRWYYGEWVPNTYFAKQVSIWPDAGLRYAGSFVLEHALWLWLPFALYVAARGLLRLEREGAPPRMLGRHVGACLVAGTLVAHAAYFVLVVGGDHFEYRVFAHAVLPLGMLLVVLLDASRLPPAWLFASFAAIAAAGEVVPWVHYHRSLERLDRAATYKMFVPIADAFPRPLRGYARRFDELQSWMMARHVGTRHREHKVFVDGDLWRHWPERHWGETVGWNQRGVLAYPTIGYIGWVLPEVAILDTHGLNDAVVSHRAVPADWHIGRVMAHELKPPAGYIECFKPNIMWQHEPPRAWVNPEGARLTDAEIVDCERRFRVEPTAAPAPPAPAGPPLRAS